MEKPLPDLLTEIIDALLDVNEVEAAASCVLRIVCEAFGWSYGAFWKLDEEARVLRCAGVWSLPCAALAEFVEVSQKQVLAPYVDLPGRVWASGLPACFSDVVPVLGVARAEPAARSGLRTALAMPAGGRRFLGVLEFLGGSAALDAVSRHPSFPNDMERIGHQIGLLLERFEREEATRRVFALKSAQFRVAPDAIISMDHHGVVIEWNPAAEALFGYGREEALGRELAELIVPLRLRQQHRQSLAHYLATGEGSIIGRHLELPALRKDGVEFPAELTVTRIPEADPPAFTGFLRDLTERRQAAEEARTATERAGLILESITDAFFALDHDWRFSYINQEAERLLGKTREQLLGRNIWEAFPDAVSLSFHHEYHRAAAENTVIQFEAYYPPLATWFDVHAYPSPEGLSVYFRDINERKQTETALRQSEERHRLLIEALPQIVWLSNADGAATYINQRWQQYTGLPSGDHQLTDWEKAIHPDDLRLLQERWKEAVRSGELFSAEVRIRRQADGRYRWHLVRGVPVRDAESRIVQWIGTSTDIDDQKRALEEAEEARQQSRRLAQQLGLITDTVPALISYLDRDYRYQLANVAYEAWFGWTREQVQGRYAWEVLGLENWERIRPHVDAALAGRVVRYEARVRQSSGEWRWVQSTLSPLHGEDGKVEGLAVLGTDITERKRREDAERLIADASKLLGTSLDCERILQDLARLVVPRLADWCVIDLVDDAGAYQRLAVEHANPEKKDLAYELYRRYRPKEYAPHGVAWVIRSGEAVLGSEIPDAVLEQAAQDEEHLRLLRELGIRSVLSVPLTAHGHTFGAITLVFGESGRIYDTQDQELVCELASRTAVAVENARLYREIQHANQAKDEFLATLAHELRNPLGAVSNALHVLKQADPHSEAYRHAEQVALRQVAHQTRMINDLLDVSRIQRNKIDLHLMPLDLVQIVRECLEDQRGNLERAGITLQSALPEDPAPILGDYTRLTQVLTNLLDNSRKFTPAGGRVRVDLTLRRDTRQVELSLQDTGSGIAPELLPHIFDPFVQADRTLARSHGGLGLGLALVKGLLELHGGTIRAKSMGPDQGAQFIITLPLRSELSLPAVEDGAPQQVGRSRRVLIIEDLRDAAETLRDLLELSGYEARIAHSGGEGLSIARTFRPDIVICDIGLPEMSGYDVAAQLRREPGAAQTRLIALTGYGALSDIEKAHAAGFDLHLTKPIQPECLQQALAEMR